MGFAPAYTKSGGGALEAVVAFSEPAKLQVATTKDNRAMVVFMVCVWLLPARAVLTRY